MPKNWKLAEKVPEEVRKKLSNYPTLAAQLLYNRGITNPEIAGSFLDVKYQDLHSPFLFRDMQKAVDRIWQAIEQNEKICIYGDYDADAVTANAVLQQTFRYLGVEVNSYIPDRFTEGYGINLEAVAKIKDQGSKIIITVDCGTNSVEVAEFCKSNGIDFIVTDHHEIIGEVPKSYALINPKNSHDIYPYQEITGVGVAFKLACGIFFDNDRVGARLARLLADDGRLKAAPTKPTTHVPGWEKWLLDLVAIGTVADCHSLMGENRVLVKFGLRVLSKTKWLGLRSLMTTAGLLNSPTSGDFVQLRKIPTDSFLRPLDTYILGFVIAPRLNAAGRLEHANIALHLLLEKDPLKATDMAVQLEEINRRRQDQTERIMSEAREQAIHFKDRKILVIAGEGWSKGVVGLAAGKLAVEFGKPTIVLERGELESTGSARTVGEFNVLEALKYSSDYLVRFGGHKQAAGLTIKTEHFDLFYQKLLEYAEINLTEDDVNRLLFLEAELSGSDLSQETCNMLSLFEPFGVDNHRPKFLIQNATVLSSKCVGKTAQHLQIRLKVGAKEIAGIYFNCGDFAKKLKFGDTIDLAAEVTEDEWNGRKQIKLRIVDIKFNAI